MRVLCWLLLFGLASVSPAFGAGPSVSVDQNALQQLANPQSVKPAKHPTPHYPVPHHPAPLPRHPIALPLPPAPAPTGPVPTRPTPHAPAPPVPRPVPPLALEFAPHSAALRTADIARIHQFAAQNANRFTRITIAAAAVATAQHPGRAYRLAFARGRAIRDSLIAAGIPLTRIIVQSQIVPINGARPNHRAILTLTP